ncbi:hypothetical protein O9992_23135 [Vibrio lentus]|nr:hypothetical protein [Vibrio lentus]
MGKFESWLEHRPGWKGYKLEQPIRWSNHDPLESGCLIASF